jgi:hypothetical protein
MTAWAALALGLRGSGDPARRAGAHLVRSLPAPPRGADLARTAAALAPLRLAGGRLAAVRASLVAGVAASLDRAGSIGDDVNATALAVIATRRAFPRSADRGARWLSRAQRSDGGFGHRAGIAPDVDSTGLAAWALAIAGRTGATRRAAAFVRGAQSRDGGYPSAPGGDSNSQSTSFAVIALRVAGIGPRRDRSDTGMSPLEYLVSLGRRGGAIAYDRGSNPTPVWTTSQALLALSTRARLLALGR